MKSAVRKRRNSAAARAKLLSLTGPDGQPLFLPFDVADYLRTEEDVAGFLTESFSDGRSDEILHAIFTACRARGMSKIARAASLGRESLYKALASRSHPRFETILKVVRALGLVMELKPASKEVRRRAAAAMAAPKRRKTVRAVAQTRRKSA
jgi:probable addiction module antidote protein